MKHYDVAAYVWPAYTGDEPRTRMFWPEGNGEWETVKSAEKKFPEHSWPRKPLWGYVNEADPRVMEMEIDAAVERTKHNDRIILSIGLNYGSRNEIMHAVRDIVAEGIAPEDITEETISDHLFTSGTPDPDLVIRTSGEERLSNFLLWQSAYSEWEFPETLWPDFGRKEVEQAIVAYSKRERRFGKL